MGKYLELNKVNKRLEKNGFKLLDKIYKGTNCKYKFLCHCGKEFEYLLNNLIGQHPIKNCGCSNLRISQKEIEDRLSKLNFILISKYIGTHKIHEIECHCGKIFKCALNRIFTGNTLSCGCIRYITETEIKNRLLKTNIRLLETYKGTELKHKFSCHCGKEFICLMHSILRGNTRSCGCIGKASKGIFGPLHPSWKGYGDIGLNYFNSIKSGAKKRNIEFKITIQFIWELFLKQNKKCALSEVDLILITRRKKGDATASLDRIDSTKGYTSDNVQWIHKDINQMKMDLPNDKFIEWCELISNFKNKETKA